MDEEQLDLMQCSIDEFRERFENYKRCCKQQFESNEKLTKEFGLEKDLQELQAELRQLHMGIKKLEKLQLTLSCRQEPDAIEELPFNMTYACDDDISSEKVEEQLEEQAEANQQLGGEQKLVISCGSSPCLFDHCRRRVDSQLLLLHYISDHSDEDAAFQRCHKIWKGKRIVLSFETRRCLFKHNLVIGLLAYGGSLMEQKISLPCHQIYNSFLPQEHMHLESDVPIVVLICKTSASSALTDKQCHANTKDQFFVIWLVTPIAQLQLNGILCLCGRNPAVKAKTILAVRPVSESQDTCEFMPVDANYWRLSYDEIRNISNEFRDELHLEVGITEQT